MNLKAILIVDDEKNIRQTLTHALAPLKMKLLTAVNGEEALTIMQEEDVGLVLLDLRMSGMDGLEVLRRMKHSWPTVRVIIITAHGTIDSAVQAMKYGAVDFIQKPFTIGEIRELIETVLKRETLAESGAEDYRALIELTKRFIADGRLTEATSAISKALAKNPKMAEAYNLLGAILEIQDQRLEAQRFYRAALDIDPTYKPAQGNLRRTTAWQAHGDILLTPDEPKG